MAPSVGRVPVAVPVGRVVWGKVVALHRCPGHRLAMEPLEEAVFLEGRGVAGDSHARPGSRRQVLLVDEAVLERFGLLPGTIRENVTVRNLPLDHLPGGTLLRLGQGVELQLTIPCTPCHRMEEIRPGLREALRGCRGVLARVVRGGRVRPGDRVEVRPAPGGAGPDR